MRTEIAGLQHVADEQLVFQLVGERIGFRDLSGVLRREHRFISADIVGRQHGVRSAVLRLRIRDARRKQNACECHAGNFEQNPHPCFYDRIVTIYGNSGKAELAHFLRDRHQITPGEALGRRLTQQVGRMKGRHYWNGAIERYTLI